MKIVLLMVIGDKKKLRKMKVTEGILQKDCNSRNELFGLPSCRFSFLMLLSERTHTCRV